MIYGVVLAGGKGERFWPLSRASHPKQFLKLTSERMMLEETIHRVLPIIPYENFRIVTGAEMEGFILDKIELLHQNNIYCEPIGRNTCVAIGLAAIHLIKDDPDAVMVVLSADHLIKPQEKLQEIISTGIELASKEDCLITIGIVPTRPETAYGYIKLGEVHETIAGRSFYKVDKFTEKPKAAMAHEYYYSQNFLWNSGMFIWSAKSILNAINNLQPELGALLEEYSQYIGTEKQSEAKHELYKKAVSISIDFAILEKADNVLTLKGDIIWDDIGGWNALSRYKHKSSENNVIEGEGIAFESYETTIFNNADGLIATVGVSDLVVVRNDNITLVVHKTKTDEIKKLLAHLDENEDTKKYL